jgi:uncharacterized protein YaaQ
MKLAVFVVENNRVDATVDALVGQGFRVTRLASTGGFLRRGNTTLLVGIEENDMDRAKTVVHGKAPGTVFLALDLDSYERL